MTTFIILSATATDVVGLGQARDEVCTVLGADRTFRRTPGSAEADRFTD